VEEGEEESLPFAASRARKKRGRGTSNLNLRERGKRRACSYPVFQCNLGEKRGKKQGEGDQDSAVLTMGKENDGAAAASLLAAPDAKKRKRKKERKRLQPTKEEGSSFLVLHE